MKNYIQPGDTLTIPVSAVAAKSGDLVVLEYLAGVSVADAVVGGPLVLVTKGVFSLPKVKTEVHSFGERLSYNTTNMNLTKTLTAGKIVAVVAEAAKNGDEYVKVKLLQTILQANSSA